MWQGLRDLFVALGCDPTLRGVVLTGANGCFSSGADIGDFEQTRATPEQGISYEVAVDEACNAIANLGCPVIAAIEGYCYGGACNLAMASDFRLVAANAKFSIPAAKLSIVYSPRGMARLVALVGVSEAKRIFYTAQPFTTERALETGFADAVEADPVAAARNWLEGIADLAPLSLAGSKAIINMIAMPEHAYDPAVAHAVTWRALTSHDYAEGRAAFAAKRPPQFKGA
jgi:enoyl-CoA hydratase/carnithine racemase